jgi:phosphoribosylformylglycinamidine cyclo-ligase
MERSTLDTYYDDLGMSLGEALLTPTKIYVKTMQGLKDGNVTIKACSHITGGGFYENIPRMLPEGMHGNVRLDSYDIPPLFKMLQREGNIADQAMYNTFNMGIGMAIVVNQDKADEAVRLINETGEKAYILGEITGGTRGISLC